MLMALALASLAGEIPSIENSRGNLIHDVNRRVEGDNTPMSSHFWLPTFQSWSRLVLVCEEKLDAPSPVFPVDAVPLVAVELDSLLTRCYWFVHDFGCSTLLACLCVSGHSPFLSAVFSRPPST